MSALGDLHALGFDRSFLVGLSTRVVDCSCCQALVINGVPTHERGCPNARHECAGCYELLPMNQKWCDSCA